MQSPDSVQPDAHLRAAPLPASVPWPRKMSMTPPITATGLRRSSAESPAATVVGQASTHLPQRVQASIMVSTRAAKADSNVSGMRADYCQTRPD